MSKTFHYRATFDVDVRVRPLTRAIIEQRRRSWRRDAPPSVKSGTASVQQQRG